MTPFPIGLTAAALGFGVVIGSTFNDWNVAYQCDKTKVVVIGSDVYKCEKQKGEVK